MKKINLIYTLLLLSLGGCKNQDWEFPDYEYKSVYFAYQTPVRTVTLGEDIFDTSMDNQYKVTVMATTGGIYKNNEDVTIDFIVDNSLTNNIAFNTTKANDILPLPSNYYTLSSDKITIPKGKIIGGVEVQLTEAFFNDPKALETNYVLPIRMTKVVNADTILSGKSLTTNPNRYIENHWQAVPKNYTLYAIKYINTWHGNYLRRGKDLVVGKNGNTSLNQTQIRHNQYKEKDEVKSLSTASLTKTKLPLTFKDVDGTNINIDLVLTFNDNNCMISSGTNNVTASGTGSFVKRGDKNSWGNKDRDVLYLDYNIEMPQMTVSTKDTLVMRDRGVKMETFTVKTK